MKFFVRILLPFGIISITLGFILFADKIIPAATSAVSLCITSVIPSLLPFFVCSRMLLGLGICEKLGEIIEKPFVKLFRLPPLFSGGFLLGSLCGFPMGAKIAASFYEKGHCTKRQAAYGAVLCNNAGPLFIIGTLGTTFLQNTTVGKQLWLLHLSSSVITALLLRHFLPTPECYVTFRQNKKTRTLDLFVEAVSDSVQTILQVCGLIIFFGAVIRTLICLGMPDSSVLIGSIEMTTGLSQLALINSDCILPLCSFLLGFGGICVFMQVATAFLPQGIPLTPYLVGKTIQGGIAATLTYLFYKIFPISTPTVANSVHAIESDSEPLLLLISVLFLALALLISYGRINRGSL